MSTQGTKFRKADYPTCRVIERFLAKAWDGRRSAYRFGQGDVAVAHQAAEEVRHPVSPSSVRTMRKQLGLMEVVGAPKSANGATHLTTTDIRQLEAALAGSRRVVCLLDRKEKFRTYSLEKYTTGQARMAKAVRVYKPWEKLPRRNGKLQKLLVSPESGVQVAA